jgi:hypothetical protein
MGTSRYSRRDFSFIRGSWGNDAKPIEAPKVAALRR